LLYYDVEDLAHSLAILSIWIVYVLSVDSILSYIIYLELDFATHQFGINDIGLFKSLCGPDIETRENEFSNQKLDFFGI
jgi:hypothetical protein